MPPKITSTLPRRLGTWRPLVFGGFGLGKVPFFWRCGGRRTVRCSRWQNGRPVGGRRGRFGRRRKQWSNRREQGGLPLRRKDFPSKPRGDASDQKSQQAEVSASSPRGHGTMVIPAVGPERLIVVQGTDPAGDSGSTATAKTQMQSPGSDARAHAPAAEV